MRAYSFIVLLAAFVMAGCDSVNSDETTSGRVAVQFGVAASETTTGASKTIFGANTLEVTGTNGTLEIDRIAFIVSELELEGDDGACDDDGNDDCAEFESGTFFVDLTLDGSPTLVSVDDVKMGTYNELEFEIENLDFDDDEEDEAQVRADIESAFDTWPEDASLYVEGRFVSNDGESRSYKAFFDAEVEIEEEFPLPLVLDETTNTSVSVDVSPSAWFVMNNGAVIDLSEFDFDSTGRIAEFEVEIEQGFTGTSFEDDDDDDEEDDD